VLTGSYALDALTGPEREDFERHLQHCASCEAEVRGLRETAARLAMAKAVRPPARMERRVLAATYRTRQLPPLPGPGARRARVARWFAGQSARVPVRTRRLVVAVAAASVAVAVVLGITQAATQHQLTSTQASGAAIARVITAPDARVQTVRTTVGGTVTVVISARQHAAVVTAAGMPPLPSARVYQLWVMSPSGARSAGLLARTALLAAAVVPGDRIGITVEPSGGTTRPTTTPILVLPLSA
jgi:hypothetical protein